LIYRLRFEAYALGFSSEATTYRFFPFELSLFLWGAVCFKIGTAVPSINKHFAVVTTMALILTLGLLPADIGKGQHRLYFWVGLFLPVLFEFGRRYRWDRSLGELSYPLYLVHWPVGAFAAMWFGTGGSAAYPIAAVVLSIAAAALVNRCVVEPIDKWRQRRARRAVVCFPEIKMATS
jgi:peptidoglycan/LPS O-acetylase OafA/YrhL